MEGTLYGSGAPATEWLEFEDPTNPGEFFKMNMSFMLSNYNCIYGAGCQSIKSDMPREEVGCCSQGVTFVDEDDLDNITKRVSELTDADCANLDYIKKATEKEGRRGWAVHSPKGEPYKTRKLGGRCIFANPAPTKEGDPGMGCSFHRLALRTGEHFTDTKPYICWLVPIYTAELETNTGEPLKLITAVSAGDWGSQDPIGTQYDENGLPSGFDDEEAALRTDYLAWWCTDTPDAYNGPDQFYKSNAAELTKIMGSTEAYEEFCRLAEQYGERRFPMPGEFVNNGQPTIATISSLYNSLRQKRDDRGTAETADAGDGHTSGSPANVS